MGKELLSERRTIGKWLIEQGTLTADQVQELLTIQRRDARAGVRSRLGEIAVRVGWADPSEVNAALRRQAATVHDHVGLSDILLALGFVTPKALDRALSTTETKPLAETLLEQGACTPDQLQAASQVLALRHASALRSVVDSAYTPVNATEILVSEQIDAVLETAGACRCLECWANVFAAAMAELPARYVSPRTRLPEVIPQYRRDYDDLIRRKLLEVIERLRSDPRSSCRARFADDMLAPGGFQGRMFPVAVRISNRHVHLSPPHVEALFGPGYTLRKQKDLVQPGQFAAEETVTLIGPKGSLEKVRVLGPPRKQTQVEISGTDQFTLGIRAPARESGHLEDTPGIQIAGPQGTITLETGVIRALRHIHVPPEDATRMGLRDGDRVCVRLEGDRPAIAEEVLVRVSSNSALEMHVDTDEANAAGLPEESTGQILLPAGG